MPKTKLKTPPRARTEKYNARDNPEVRQGVSVLSERLRRAREDLGLSQPEAAEMSGLSVWAIRQWEQGRCLPAYYALNILVERAGYDPEILLPAAG